MAEGSGTLLVDKYRSHKLESLDYHPELSQRLKALSKGNDFPHTLFYGPSGAGKKTRIMCCLRELYGPGVEKLRIEQRVFMTPSRRKLDINIVQSNFHLELTPSDVGQYDRVVVQEILKEIAQSQQIDLKAQKRFKAVVINEADLLSRDAQSALRRTMEKYSTNLRLILCANSTSRIIGPIRSRCLLLRVGAPTESEIFEVLQKTASKVPFDLPDHVNTVITRTSQGNLRRALLSLEGLRVQDPTFKSISPDHSLARGNKLESKDLDRVPRPDWEKYASACAEKIIKNQTPEALLDVRSMLYELLVHCIPGTIIISTITKRLLQRVGESVKGDVAYWAAFYEHRLKTGSKPIFHLEAFCAKVMHVIKQHQLGRQE